MSDDNVVIFNGVTSLPIDPERVLRAALEARLTEVVVLGRQPNGEEYFAQAGDSLAEAFWLVDRFKHVMLKDQD